MQSLKSLGVLAGVARPSLLAAARPVAIRAAASFRQRGIQQALSASTKPQARGFAATAASQVPPRVPLIARVARELELDGLPMDSKFYYKSPAQRGDVPKAGAMFWTAVAAFSLGYLYKRREFDEMARENAKLIQTIRDHRREGVWVAQRPSNIYREGHVGTAYNEKAEKKEAQKLLALEAGSFSKAEDYSAYLAGELPAKFQK